MKTLSNSTKAFLVANAITCYYNEATDKFEIHYPSNNFDYCETEEEVLNLAKEYVEFWDNRNNY